MFCPKCGKENKNESQFCKYCGASLKQAPKNNEPVVVNNKDDDKKNYLIIGLVAVIAIVLLISGLAIAGVFDGGNNGAINNTTDAAPVNSGSDGGNAPAATTTTSSSNNNNKPLNILGGSFSTGSSSSDLTYAHIYVGTQHAGETVKITAIWSRDGSNLNSGNILTRTVDSSGYVNFNSANAFSYFPDKAIVKLYYSDGSLADQTTVTLSPSSGTQTF